jgi:spore coat polysaccharide biosynthesis predicted glycosyltransferase SpsG/RimJ/RimL family protein N-acetyltransferase
MRCLAVAETLAWASWEVGFVSAAGTVETAPAIANAGFPVKEPGDGALAGADVAVFDHYGIDAQAEAREAPGVPLRVAVDDRPSRDHRADIVIDSNPSRRPEDYCHRITPEARVLAGARYAPLRRCWLEWRASALARTRGSTPRRILVSMGATDPTNATAKVLAALKRADLPADIDVVLGANAPHRGEIAREIGSRDRLHIDPDLPRLCADADFAIGAAGSSCFERACVGLPSLIVVVVDNQGDLAPAFAHAGAARVIPREVFDDPPTLARAIADFASDTAARRVMAQAAVALVDGRGTQRLLLALAGEAEAAAGSVRLRLAEASDRDWLLDLQRKPETRRFASNPEIPSTAEHAAWFARTLVNPDRLLAIVESGGDACGMIRIDALSEPRPAFEVSIAIAPERHGRRMGRAALSLLRRAVPLADLVATVLPDNAASRALFARGGFCSDGENRYRSRAA